MNDSIKRRKLNEGVKKSNPTNMLDEFKKRNKYGDDVFRSLLHRLYLLIDKEENELNLSSAYLTDQSMILLSEELHKYPNLKMIDITNNNIHSNGLKALFLYKSPNTKIIFDYNGSKELLIDKDIPELIKYIRYKYKHYCSNAISYGLNLSNSEIDDSIFETFISLRSGELERIRDLYLRNNKLTFESIEILINNYNISSFPNLKELHLNGNLIGNEGMKILSPHLKLLKDDDNKINCSKMGLSSIGLKYLLDGLKDIDENIYLLDISGNNIHSNGIDYLKNYMKKNHNINRIIIHSNPIGNDGFNGFIIDNPNGNIGFTRYLVDNPIGNIGLESLQDNLKRLNFEYEMNLSNICIDDESVMLIANNIDLIGKCEIINLNGNNIKMNGLKSICGKSLENVRNPFIQMKYSSWTNEEMEYYFGYCNKKNRIDLIKNYDFSKLNLNDSHIYLIKHIDYEYLDLSNNRITIKGFKELLKSLPKYVRQIDIYNNPIGGEGMEIINKYKYIIEYTEKGHLEFENEIYR